MPPLFVNTTLVLTSAAIIAFAWPASAALIDINGGSSWSGWTSKGQSNQLGVWAREPAPGNGTTDVYEVYATSFNFNSTDNFKTGSPLGGGPTGGTTGFGTGTYSTGAFANGNRILGIGVRRISGSSLSGTRTVRFDLDSDSYQAATSVGGTDGRASSSSYSEFKDFTVQFSPSASPAWSGSDLSVQTSAGSSYGGSGASGFVSLSAGGVGSDYAFRAFALANSYQMFFDVDAMQTLYGGSNPFNLYPGFVGIGAVGNTVRISLNGLGDNDTVFNASVVAPVAPVPEPATVGAIFGGACLGVGMLLRRRRSARA